MPSSRKRPVIKFKIMVAAANFRFCFDSLLLISGLLCGDKSLACVCVCGSFLLINFLWETSILFAQKYKTLLSTGEVKNQKWLLISL